MSIGLPDRLLLSAPAFSRALTIVLPFDEGLPLAKPLHADAVDDAGGLLGLEGFVELEGREQGTILVGQSPLPPTQGKGNLTVGTRHLSEAVP